MTWEAVVGATGGPSCGSPSGTHVRTVSTSHYISSVETNAGIPANGAGVLVRDGSSALWGATITAGGGTRTAHNDPSDWTYAYAYDAGGNIYNEYLNESTCTPGGLDITPQLMPVDDLNGSFNCEFSGGIIPTGIETSPRTPGGTMTGATLDFSGIEVTIDFGGSTQTYSASSIAGMTTDLSGTHPNGIVTLQMDPI